MRRALGTALVVAASLGCRENVYVGDPLYGSDRVVGEAGAPPDAGNPVEAGRPESGPGDAARDAGPYPWYLHAVGSRLVDSSNHVVRLKGVNWSGMQGPARVPDGLGARTIESLMSDIDRLGFNLVRIPYSNESLTPTATPVTLGGVDPIARNPDLVGRTSVEILDLIIDAAAAHHIRVILDRFRFGADTTLPAAKWYSGATATSTDGGYPEQRWIDDWKMLATRYTTKPNMVGCDLHEEPANPATWGDGNPDTDWKLAAETAGNAILAANPRLLVIVQGLDTVDGLPYWAGGNLRKARTAPVMLTDRAQLAYAIHDYGKSVTDQPWFDDPTFPANLGALWDDRWGYLLQQGTAPVIVTAFGDRKHAPTVSLGDMAADDAWRGALMGYLEGKNASYAFWAVNPSAEGKAGLFDTSWQNVDPEWAGLLGLSTGPRD